LGKVVNGVPTIYVQDVAAQLPLVLTETTGGQTKRYLYGNDLLSQASPADAPKYYHADGVGSTRAISDIAGAVAESYTYGAFGTSRGQAGAASQDHLYSGEQFEASLGIYYLRARFYDPDAGRFLTKDRWPLSTSDTQTINRYVYVENNPIRLTDPSGLTAKDMGSASFFARGNLSVVGSTVDLNMLEQLAKFHSGFNWTADAYFELAPTYLTWAYETERASSSNIIYARNLGYLGTIFDLINLVPSARDSLERWRRGEVYGYRPLTAAVEAGAFSMDAVLDRTARKVGAGYKALVRPRLNDNSNFVQNVDLLFHAWDQDITGTKMMDTIYAVVDAGPRDFVRYTLIGAGLTEPENILR
jgi:RHS repeat-associated protein